MADQPNVLFLLEGFAETVIESQVLANIRLIQDRSIASYDIWAFTYVGAIITVSQERLLAAENLAQAPMKVISSIRPWTPVAYILNVFLLGIKLFPRRHSYTHIHARTDYVAAVAGPVAWLFGIKLIWDCRGDASAEVEENLLSKWSNFRLLVYIRVAEIRFYTWLANVFSSAAIFVTEELRDVRKFKNKKKESVIIPCAANEEFFFYDKFLRDNTREQLGYLHQNTVFVYSGSLARYQCFPEAVKLFSSLSEINPDYRLLVLTPFKDAALSALVSLSKDIYEVKACTLLQINAYLNAADVGFLIRKSMKTNWVASPTKFAEYMLAGLQILTTEAIPYVYKTASEGEALIKDPRDMTLWTTEERTMASETFARSVGRKRFIEDYRRLYDF